MKKNILYFLFVCSATSVSVNAAIGRYGQAGIYDRYKWALQEANVDAPRAPRHAITGPRTNFAPPPPDILFEQVDSSADHSPIAPPLSQGGWAIATTRDQQKIYTAATNGNLMEIQKCITMGMDIDTPDYGDGNDCYTPLLKAAQAGHNDVVIALLDGGANVNFVSDNTNLRENGNTALILASYKGHLSVVRTLLNRGANVDHETESGYTALMFATYERMACWDEKKKHDFDRIVEALYLAGASMPLPDLSHGAASAASGMGDNVPPLEPADGELGDEVD